MPIPLNVACKHSPNSPDGPDMASEQSLLKGILALSGNSWLYLAKFVLGGSRKEIGEEKRNGALPFFFDFINV